MMDAVRIRKPSHYNASPVLVLGLLAYTISVYAATGERLDILAAVRHQLLMGVVLLGFAAKSMMDDLPDLAASKGLLVLMGALFLVIVTQVPFAADRDAAWDTFFDYTLKQALFAIFIVALIRSPRDMRWFLIAFMFAIAWVLAEAVRGQITGALVWRNQGIRRLHGAVNLYRHPNGLSLMAVTSLPFIIYLFPVIRNWFLRLGMLAMVGMAGVCIIYTGSRAGYVGTLAVIGFWWWFSKQKAKGLAVGLLCGALLLVVLPEQYRERFTSIGGEEKEGHSRETRIQIMRDAWAVFQDNPFGVGVNSFMLVRQQRFGEVQDVHMLYLQVLTHIGIQGFAVFMAFVAALYLSFDRIVHRQESFVEQLVSLGRRQRPPPARLAAFRTLYQDAHFAEAVAKAFRLYVLMLLVNGVFAHTLYLICWWFAAGAAVALQTIGDRLAADGRYLRQVSEADTAADPAALLPGGRS